jgi:uncharacterized protein (DUF58 family)
VKPSLRDSPLGLTLAWVALGLTIVAGAFGAHPVKASSLVFWALIVVGALVIAGGTIAHFRRGPRRQLVASECRRIHGCLKRLLADQERLRPRPGRFGNGQERFDAWLAETAYRYEHELRTWVTKVFDQVVATGAVSEASRSLLDGKSLFQLNALRDLFGDAAEELEQI